jgi:hypothetical protein
MGEQVLARGLTRLSDGCKDLSPAWHQIHDNFLQIEREQFYSGGARSGHQWQPLSPSYAVWKAKHFPGKPIMQRTGAMMADFTSTIPTQIEPLRLTMTPATPYAIYHQQGRGFNPVRKVVQLTESDKTTWIEFISRHIRNQKSEAGLQ